MEQKRRTDSHRRADGSALRRARRARGWSQRDVAERLGTDDFTVSRWERGVALPGPHFRQRLAALFEQDLAALGLLEPQGGETRALERPTPVVMAGSARDVGRGAAPPYLLPARPVRLIGRSETADEVLCLLADVADASRLARVLAIVGPPGAGKSALAAEVLHRVAALASVCARFPDGIVALSGAGLVGEHGLIALLDALAARFGSPHPLVAASTAAAAEPNGLTCAQALGVALDRARVALAGRRALVLLDDLRADIPLPPLRQVVGPGCALVLTGPVVPPASLGARVIPLGPLDTDDAVALLGALLGRRLVGNERAVAVRLCRAVGGLPIAVEGLARAWAIGIPDAVLEAAISGASLALLDADAGNLRARLDRALDGVSERTRERFLWVAATGRDDVALADIAEADATDGELVAEAGPAADAGGGRARDARLVGAAADVAELVRHNLLDPVCRDDGALVITDEGARYRVQPLLRLHAADTWRGRCEAALDFAERHRDAMPELDRRAPDLVRAVAAAHAHGHDGLVVALLVRLLPFMGRLPNARGILLLEWGVRASEHAGDRYQLARFLNRLAKLHMQRGDFGAARATWETCREVGGSLFAGLPSERAAQLIRPWGGLCLLACAQGDVAAATRYAREGLRLSEAIGDRASVAEMLTKVGACARLAGDLDAAGRALEEADALHGQGAASGPGSAAFGTLDVRLELARVRGDFAGSQAVAEDLVTLARVWGDRWIIPLLRLEQGELACEHGLYTEARRLALLAVEAATACAATALRDDGLALLGRTIQ